MSRRIPYPAYALLGLLSVATLGGCQNGFTGTLEFNVFGSPLEGTENVVLAVKAVTLGGDGGQNTVSFGSEQFVDIDAGQTPVLQDVLVPAGDYKWIRLDIDVADSYVIASNGGRYALNVPSTFQSKANFTVGEGLTTEMLMYVNLPQALSPETQDGIRTYTLQPISRLVNVDDVGTIFGTIPADLMIGGLTITDPSCNPEAYAYAGSDVVPEGYFVAVKGGTAPFSSAPTTLHVFQEIYVFTVKLLPPGTYTVAITCAAEDTAGSKSIDFSPTKTVEVTVGHQTTVIF
jgi:hypothetical protein